MPDAMNSNLPSPAAPDEEAAFARARTETQLGSLAEARELTLGFLRRLDRVAEGLSAERQVELLAENGQMILNVVRTDRAIRQIVAMEQEVMGLREPPAPRGFAGRGPSGGGNGGGERLNDLNDLGDLDDPREVQDIHDLLAVEDLGEIEDLDLYYDLAAVEKHETIDALRRHIKNDPAAPGPSREEIEAEITERLDEWRVLMDSGEFPPEKDITPEEKRRRILEIEATMRAEIDAADAKEEAEWRIVRAALLRRRAIEKEARRKRGRRSRGPP